MGVFNSIFATRNRVITGFLFLYFFGFMSFCYTVGFYGLFGDVELATIFGITMILNLFLIFFTKSAKTYRIFIISLIVFIVIELSVKQVIFYENPLQLFSDPFFGFILLFDLLFVVFVSIYIFKQQKLNCKDRVSYRYMLVVFIVAELIFLALYSIRNIFN